MLETIREFASERLQRLPEAGDMLERHARWYLHVAKSDGSLDGDLENVRAAIRWAQNCDGHLEVDLAGATWRFLSNHGLFREALSYLRHALETAQSLSVDQSALLGGAVYVSIRTGDYAAGRQWGEQNLELARIRGNSPAIAWALVGLGLVLRQQGDYKRARTLYLEGAEIAERCGEPSILAVIVYNLGEIELIEGDAEAAQVHFRETLELTRELSDPGGQAFALVGLSLAALTEQDTDTAAAFLDRSLRLASNLEARELLFSVLLGTAEVAAQRSETARATRLLAATDALREEMGYTPSPLERDQHTRITTALGNDPALNAVRSDGRTLTLDEAIAYALEQPA